MSTSIAASTTTTSSGNSSRADLAVECLEYVSREVLAELLQRDVHGIYRIMPPDSCNSIMKKVALNDGNMDTPLLARVTIHRARAQKLEWIVGEGTCAAGEGSSSPSRKS